MRAKTRLLVFLEAKPLSNKYRQVILSKEQYKQITEDICDNIVNNPKKGDQLCYMTFSRALYDLPDLQHIHSKDKNPTQGGA